MQLLHACILHIRPFKETSVIVDLFTPSNGKISAIAQGAKRPKSRIKGYIQPFYPLNIQLVGRGGLKKITHIEPYLAAFRLEGMRLIAGLYLNELLMNFLTEDESYEVLYLDYIQTLMQLNIKDKVNEAALRYFEMSLLSHLGYGLDLSVDTDKNPIDFNKNYCYHHEFGLKPTYLLESSQYIVIEGSSLIALMNKDLQTQNQLQDAKKLMRMVLNRYMGNKPMHTRALFADFVKLQQVSCDNKD